MVVTLISRFSGKELSFYRNDSKSCETVLLLCVALWYIYLVHEEKGAHMVHSGYLNIYQMTV
jgi:hypothetical protein